MQLASMETEDHLAPEDIGLQEPKPAAELLAKAYGLSLSGEKLFRGKVEWTVQTSGIDGIGYSTHDAYRICTHADYALRLTCPYAKNEAVEGEGAAADIERTSTGSIRGSTPPENPLAVNSSSGKHLSSGGPAIKDGAIYEIEPRSAFGTRIDVNGGRDKNGTEILQVPRNGSRAQQFKVHEVEGGYYVFEPLCAPGKAIDNKKKNAPCHLWDHNGLKNETSHFKLEPTGDGYFGIVSRTRGGSCWESKDTPHPFVERLGRLWAVPTLLQEDPEGSFVPRPRQFRFIGEDEDVEGTFSRADKIMTLPAIKVATNSDGGEEGDFLGSEGIDCLTCLHGKVDVEERQITDIEDHAALAPLLLGLMGRSDSLAFEVVLKSQAFVDPDRALAITNSRPDFNIVHLPVPDIVANPRHPSQLSVRDLPLWTDFGLHPMHWYFAKGSKELQQQLEPVMTGHSQLRAEEMARLCGHATHDKDIAARLQQWACQSTPARDLNHSLNERKAAWQAGEKSSVSDADPRSARERKAEGDRLLMERRDPHSILSHGYLLTPLHYAAMYGGVDQETFDHLVNMLPSDDPLALDVRSIAFPDSHLFAAHKLSMDWDFINGRLVPVLPKEEEAAIIDIDDKEETVEWWQSKTCTNRPRCGGLTPLHLAILCDRYEVAQMLVVGESGIRGRAADPTESCAIRYAKQEQNLSDRKCKVEFVQRDAYDLVLMQWGAERRKATAAGDKAGSEQARFKIQQWQKLIRLMETGSNGPKVIGKLSGVGGPKITVTKSLFFALLFVLVFLGVGFMYNPRYPVAITDSMEELIEGCLGPFQGTLFKELTKCNSSSANNHCGGSARDFPGPFSPAFQCSGVQWTEALVLVHQREPDDRLWSGVVSVRPDSLPITVIDASAGGFVLSMRFASQSGYVFLPTEKETADAASPNGAWTQVLDTVTEGSSLARYTVATEMTTSGSSHQFRSYSHRIMNRASAVDAWPYHVLMIGLVSASALWGTFTLLGFVLMRLGVISPDNERLNDYLQKKYNIGMQGALVERNVMSHSKDISWGFLEFIVLILVIWPSIEAIQLQQLLTSQGSDYVPDWHTAGIWVRIGFRAKIASVLCAIPGLRFLQWLPNRKAMGPTLVLLGIITAFFVLYSLQSAALFHLQGGMLDVFNLKFLTSFSFLSGVSLMGSVTGVVWNRGVADVDDELRQMQYKAVLNHSTHGALERNMKLLTWLALLATVTIVLATALVFVGPTLFLTVPRDGLNSVDDPVDFLLPR